MICDELLINGARVAGLQAPEPSKGIWFPNLDACHVHGFHLRLHGLWTVNYIIELWHLCTIIFLIISTQHLNGNNNAISSAEEEADMNRKILIIVSTILGTFLLISCILVLCFYYRWKKAKHRQRNSDRSLSVPSFFFQPETPVFLIGAENSSQENKKSRAANKSKKMMMKLKGGSTNNQDKTKATINDIEEQPHILSSEPNLYAENPSGVGRQPTRKVGSIRQLYASIGRL